MASTSQWQCMCATVLLFILGIWVSQVVSMSPTLDEVSLSNMHEEWIARHGRVYKDAAEKEKRFQIFKSNVEFINSVNSNGSKSYKLGVNQFADLTNEEFRASFSGFKTLSSYVKSMEAKPFLYENVTKVPASIDWRQKGAVTPIKDQSTCGCCWAFSAVAAVEGIIKIKTGKLVSLSEQELLDCDIAGDNKGCDGGLMNGAFEFIKKNKGITTEAAYPYKKARGTCRASTTSRTAKISGYSNVPANNEKELLKAVANQPVSVGVSSGNEFQFYKSGVFSGDCGDELDHAVTIIGYGKDKFEGKYWLVKNSWGLIWGEEGYGRFKRDVVNKQGICSLAMIASFPTA